MGREIFRYTLLATWGMVTLVLLFTVIFLGYNTLQQGRRPPTAGITTFKGEVPAEPTSEGGAARDVLLYFADNKRLGLRAELQHMPLTGSTAANCRHIVEALIRGPEDGLIPILPKDTTVRGIYLLDGGELVIDFSRELEVGLARSASAELLMVYGVVASVTQNAVQLPNRPAVKSVRFLVEGAPPHDSFPAHVDLSETVVLDRAWMGRAEDSPSNG